MGMVIGTNVASLTAQRHLASSRADMETSMERLASGQRINSAADDAAGLAIANKMEVKVMSLNQSVRNANDGISMIQVAEGGMEEIGNMLGRMKELAVQASNGTYTAQSLTTMNNEYRGLETEITRIAQTTDFNGAAILSSVSPTGIHVGDSAVDTVALSFQDMRGAELGGGLVSVGRNATVAVTQNASAAAPEITAITMAAVDTVKTTESLRITVDGTEFTQPFVTDAATTFTNLATQVQASASVATAAASVVAGNNVLTITAANNNVSLAASTVEVATTVTSIIATSLTDSDLARVAMGSIDLAIAKVDAYRADLGSLAKTLYHTVSNLMNRGESQSSAMSRIKDADYAVESANLAKAQVLQQAGTAMLAQANASGEGVLQLLK